MLCTVDKKWKKISNSTSVYFWVVGFFFKILCIFYLVIGIALCLHCCLQIFSNCGEWGILFLAVHGPLLRWLLLLQSTGSRCVGFSNCSMWAQ